MVLSLHSSTSCTEHLRNCIVCHWLLNVLHSAPSATHSVAKDDVVISSKGWVCIPVLEDIIGALLCRQPEKGETDDSRDVGNSSFWHRINSALLISPILRLSQTITRVALFTQTWHSISLPHPLSLLALSAGYPQQKQARAGKCRWVDSHQQIEAQCVLKKIYSWPHVLDKDFWCNVKGKRKEKSFTCKCFSICAFVLP